MDAIKLLHTADLHLDSPLKSLALRDPDLRDVIANATRSALTRIVDIALNERAAGLLIAGDLFDNKERSAQTGAFLIDQMMRLRAAGIRVFVIKGNHDAENPITGALDLPDNVHSFDARGGRIALRDDLWIHGVSFAERHAPNSLLPRFGAPVAGAVNIAMLHTSLAGAPGHDSYAPCSVSDLIAMGFDYWALGHVHKHTVHSMAPWIVMPGNPQGRDIGEAGPKSCTLLTIQNRNISVRDVPTAEVTFAHSNLDISGAQTDDEVRTCLKAHLQAEADTLTAPHGVLRLTLSGHTKRHWHMLRQRDTWQAFATDLARQTGRLWLDKLLLDLTPPQTKESQSGAVDELAALMGQIRNEPGFETAAADAVDALLTDLPPAVRDRLAPDAEALAHLIRDLTERGAAQVRAHMQGAED